MLLTNPWVGYIDRSYQQIKNSILGLVPITNPEITDLSESNILVIIISMFAGVAEMLNYYVDNMAREAFLQTAQRYTSIIYLVRILDYRINTCFAAGVNLVFTLLDNAGNPINAVTPYIIPQGTIVQTTNGVQFITTTNLLIPIGSSSGTIGASQYQIVPNVLLGISTNLPNQKFLLGQSIVSDSVNITINGVIWTQAATFAFSSPTSKTFIVDIEVDGNAYAYFGDGVYGMIPPSGSNIYATLETCNGSSANLISPNTINVLVSTLTSLPTGAVTVSVTNPSSPNGGSDYEAFELVKYRAPLSVRTLWRAVTYQDYEDVALLYPQTQYAEVDFCCCDSCIKLYMAPVGGGIAQLPALNGLQDWMNCKKMVGKNVCVKPAGITHIQVHVAVCPNYRQDPIQCSADSLAQILAYGAYTNQGINTRISSSAILSMVQSLASVNYVDMVGLMTVPYARNSSTYTELNWNRQMNSTGQTENKWSVQYSQSSNIFAVMRNGFFIGTASLGVLYLSGYELDFTILSGPYADGATWTFTTYPIYPYSSDIQIDDFTVPIIEAADVIIDMIPSNATNCRPNCNC